MYGLRRGWRLPGCYLDNNEDDSTHDGYSNQSSHREHDGIDVVGIALKVTASANHLHSSLGWSGEVGHPNGAVADDLCGVWSVGTLGVRPRHN